MTSFDIKEQYDKIYRYCYFKLQNADLAEDITQEAFLKLYEHYGFLSGTGAIKALYTIAGNLCIDEFRKNKPLTLDKEIAGPSHEDEVIRSVTVRKALSRLTKDEQEILFLRYANDLQVNVISDLLNISRFAARRKILSAKEKLKQELRKEGTYE